MVRGSGRKSLGKIPRKDVSTEEENSASSRDSSPAREEESRVYLNLDAAAVIEEVPPMEEEDVDPQDTQRTSEEDENTEDERRDQEDELGDVRPGTKRKRRALPVILPENVERDLGEWLEHEVQYFYDKSLPDYKNRAKQRTVLEEKGKTFDPPVPLEQLLQWLKTIRTRYVFLYYLII